MFLLFHGENCRRMVINLSVLYFDIAIVSSYGIPIVRQVYN